MPTAKKDETVVLLTEIRDLLQANQEMLTKTRNAQGRSRVLHYIFNSLIVLFVAFATYFYYHTLVASFGN